MRRAFAVITLVFGLLGRALAATPAPTFVVMVPQHTNLKVGQTTIVMVSLVGPAPLHLGETTLDSDLQVRFNVPSCVGVIDVVRMQSFSPDEGFSWTKVSARAAADYVINQEVPVWTPAPGIAGGLVRTPPFDVQMAPLYAVTLKAFAACHGDLDLRRSYMGMNNPATILLDGAVDVTALTPAARPKWLTAPPIPAPAP